MQIIVPEKNYNFFSINEEVTKYIMDFGEDYLTSFSEVELVLPDSCKDAIHVLYMLLDKPYITRLSVPQDFGSSSFNSDELLLENEPLYNFESTLPEEKMIKDCLLKNFIEIKKIQDLIYKNKIQNIAGYPDYNNNFLRACYFSKFPNHLSSINFRSENTAIANHSLFCEDGIIYSRDKRILYKHLPGKKHNLLAISNLVEIIADNAFKNCKEISKITIPDSVIYIGNNCFTNCNAQIE